MKQKSQKIVAVLTVLLMVALANQSFSQLREHVPASKYAKYVGNLQNGINSDNVGLKRNAIQYTGIYQITENSELLILKYKEEKDPNIKNLIAIALYMLGDSEVLAKIGLNEKSILKNISLSMLTEIYKVRSESKIRDFITFNK